MIKSVNLLLKSNLLVLHKAAIFKKKVTLFRETNYILSKRRKTKNKRF